MIKKDQICLYCGADLTPNLTCRNVKCDSYTFSQGNRVILFQNPDYGTGFIDNILDFKTPYEFCSDDEEVEEINEGRNDLDPITPLFYEKPIYRVKFKLYFEQIVPAEDLRHEIFDVDSEVRTRYGNATIKKINILKKKKEISYDVIFEDQTLRNLKENEILELVLDPVQSLKLYKLSRTPVLFLLNILGKIFHNTYSSNTIKFITNSRLSLMPHQVFVAHELIMKFLPRYILADEVGLGKTIETGIFIKEMISRGIFKKILIVVPANLIDQWIFEFKNKFSIDLEKFDSKFAKNLDRCDHPNVFFRKDKQKNYPFLITSLQLARFMKYRKILTSIYWDVVVFDEAHHLRRHISNTGKYIPTLSFTLAKKLSEKARTILLLTATPIQLYSIDLFNLLSIIRPDVFTNFMDFEEERKKIPVIKMLIRNLRNFQNLNMYQKENIIDLIHNILRTPSMLNKSIGTFYDSIIEQTEKLEKNTSDLSNKVQEQNNIEQLNLTEQKEQKQPDDDKKIHFKNISPDNKTHLKELIETSLAKEFGGKVLSYSKIKKLVFSFIGRQKIIDILRDDHFLSHFMFRNRKRVVFPDKFVKRIVKNIEVYLTDEELNLYKEIRLYLAKTYNKALDSKNNALGFVMVVLQQLLASSPAALISSLEKRIAKINSTLENKYNDISIENISDEENYDIIKTEFYGINEFEIVEDDDISKKAIEKQKEFILTVNHLKILEEFLQRLKLLNDDSKLNSLVKIVNQIYNSSDIKSNKKKIIIFTQFKKTLFYIRDKLKTLGYTVEEFHGDLTREKKEEAVVRFKNDCQILISTEIGGEGRNFQFCNILINYDLPWNPMRLEQRIGRLDRIGQNYDVYIFNFSTIGTIECRILEILEKRIHLFEESIGNLEPILKEIENSIKSSVFSESYTDSIDSFDMEITRVQNKMEIVESQLDDFVMDKKSFQIGETQEILEDSQNLIDEEDIKLLFELFIKNFGGINGAITRRELPNGQYFYDIKIDNEIQKKLGLEKSFYSGVFNLDIAKQNEDLDFFALGHPLVNSVADYCRGTDIGNPSTILNVDFGKILSQIGVQIDVDERKSIEMFLSGKLDLFYLVFECEYSGIILEKKIEPVVITSEGKILPETSSYLSKPRTVLNLIKKSDIDFMSSLQQKIMKIPSEKLNELVRIAKNHFNKKLIQTRAKMAELNEQMFKKELHRLLTLHEYKTRHILRSIKSNKSRIAILQKRKPTKRQWMNLDKIQDKERRKDKEEKFNSIERDMQILHIEIDDLEKKMEEIEFDLPSDVKRFEFYRNLSKRVWLSHIAIIVKDT